MGYANIQADSNFYRQSLNADGVKYVTGPYTSLYEDVFRAVTVTTDSVVSVTSYVGDSLSNQFLLAGTEIYGLFSSVTIHSGKAVLHLAGASYISEIINQYSASGIPLGFYEEGTQCLSQKISALLTQGLFDDASWVMVPSQYEEDWVRAFKPTSELGNLAFTRSSDATFTDSTGVVRRSPWNLLTWSEMFSDVAWSKVNSTIEVNTAIAPNGTLTADELFFTASSGLHLFGQVVSFISGTAYTQTYFVKNNGQNFIQIYTAGTGMAFSDYVNFDLTTGTISASSGMSGTITNNGNGWYRISATKTAGANGTGLLGISSIPTSTSGYRPSYTASGLSIYVWGAQLVEGTEALPYFATTNRQDVPRLDYRNADGTLSTCPRLLLEPQRTNSIRNSSMVGAVAGSPGTLPTNWAVANAGLTQTIVGIGTESGLPYIDLRFNGTATMVTGQIELETFNQIAASNAQTWAGSFWFKIVSAPTPPLSYQIRFREGTAAGTFVADGLSTFVPTTTLQRFTYVRTNTGATTERIQPVIRYTLTNGAAYDFTIRIAAPQMELGAFATTWVPTTTTAVTRIADVATNKNANFLPTGYPFTLFAEMHITNTVSNFPMTFIWDITSSSYFSIEQLGNTWSAIARPNTTVVSASTTLTTTLGTHKVAAVFTANTIKLFLNGALIASAVNNQSFNANINDILVGQLRTVNDTGTRTPIAQSAIFNSALSDAECIALTTL